MQSGVAVREGKARAHAAPRVDAGAPPRTGNETERRGLAMPDYVTLSAIGVVVLLVSLPKLRAFALRENELDAVTTLRVLQVDATQRSSVMRAGGLGALLASNDTHRVRLDDVELLPEGRLRRHGYLFDAVEAAPRRWVLRAWPWEHAHTGLGAFEAAVVETSRREAEGETTGLVLGHANPDGAFSGPGSAPPALLVPPDASWVAMPGG